MGWSRLVVPALAGFAVLAPIHPARAAENEVRGSYRVTLLGVEVAKANLAIKVKDDLYTVRLGYRTAGVASLGSGAKGEAQASGQIKAGKVLSGAYKLNSEEGEDSKDVSIDLDSGKVKATTALPPLKPADDRVPLTPAKLAGVMDPLSALVVPADKPDAPLDPAVCNKVLPLFDGWTRYDLQLSMKASGQATIKGYKGPAITCAVRWVPVAGHRPNTSGTRFMAENKDIEVSLVPTGSGLLLPTRVSLKTRAGTIVIAADAISQTSDGAAKSN